ncbi:MAG: aspartate kinase [Bacteroidales bacterium]
MMKVFKFGGASVKDASSIRNMSSILQLFTDVKLLVVVSAMGKTTNLLEKLLASSRNKDGDFDQLFSQLTEFHIDISKELFENPDHSIYQRLQITFDEVKVKLLDIKTFESFDYHYDACISYGELLSTYILDAYLHSVNLKFKLIDSRDFILTDEQFRNANVDWQKTEANILKLTTESYYYLTQGFIGRSHSGHTTTLGREGSDYTAAIYAACLNASEVTIWKDVPGLLNADPKRFDETVKLEEISYNEAIELAYYGATIIHPKTIKPLQNKNIQLNVKSFLQPDLSPSVITTKTEADHIVPSYILKENQMLVSISPRDFSFMNETNLYRIFGVLSDIRMPVNVMQTSAISLSLCTDFQEDKLDKLIENLRNDFTVRYNRDLTLLTIRHYNQGPLPDFVTSRSVLLEQRSRVTLQLVLK